MAQNQQSQTNGVLVYIVERYGQIVGVYSTFEDAAQVQKTSIAKGNVCNLIVKPLIESANGKS